MIMEHLRRIYLPGLRVGENSLSSSEFHHARHVLRLRKSDKIELFDGAGRRGVAEVISISKTEMLLSAEQVLTEGPKLPEITLASAIPKYSHQESLVRMCTETGVNIFQPVIFQRSSVRDKFNIEKWQRWTIEACKQCGANYLPKVFPPLRFADFISTISRFESVIFGDSESASAKVSFSGTKKILLIVGPEGGLTEGERSELRDNSAVGIRIGTNVLRVETAGVAICAAIVSECAGQNLQKQAHPSPTAVATA